MGNHFASIDDYISTFPEPVQAVLEQVRQTIRRVVPDAEEAIRYEMPTFMVNGKSLVHFAGWKKHIGLYPMPEPEDDTERELAPYRTEKGIGQFPLTGEVAYDVIEQAVAQLLRQRTASEDVPRRPVNQ
jgi:uncharacterized protein YdhG (YjbR/CyaY superfamily)